METLRTFFSRLLGMLVTASMLLTALVSEHPKDKPAFTPGEPLEQTPFSCGAEDPCGEAAAEDLALTFNAVYRLFGGVDTERLLVSRHGNEPTWYEWMALKTAWCDDPGFIREVKDRIRDFPQTDNGYLWSWGDSPCWPTGNGALHYDGLFRYVAAVADYLRWAGDTAFLDETDRTTFGADRAADASEGRTVYEKCALAMRYACGELNGRNGLITITERSAYLADGVTRFDIGADGTPVWNNTGRAGSAPSNYWDNLCFGHEDAYETALFYNALNAMRDIETMRGDEAAAAECEALAAKVKAAFNKTFWSCRTGRYIGCIDADGRAWDGGFTFLNLEALAYGLGDGAKAAMIFSWIDGLRIVPGDSLRGREITDYTLFLTRNLGPGAAKKPMYFVPAANTVSVERLSGLGEPWWCSLNGAINTGLRQNACYGQHLENGGYIFYTLYYELAARQRYLGADSVLRRARELAAVYRFNGFDTDIGWAQGLTGVFPESGIVTRAFISNLVGADAATDGLTVRPDVPKGVETLGAEALAYRGVPIEITAGAARMTLTAEGPLTGLLRYEPQAPGVYTVTVTAADGAEKTFTRETDGDGRIVIDMGAEKAVKIEVNKAEQFSCGIEGPAPALYYVYGVEKSGARPVCQRRDGR